MYYRHCRAVRRTAKSEDCRNISLWYPLSITYGGFLVVCHYSDCNDKICPPAVWLVKKTVRQIPPVQTVAGMVCCIIAVNLAVLILTDTTYGSETFEFRYHLIPVVSGFLIVGIGIGGLVAWLKAHPNPLIFTSAMASIAIIWLLCNIVFYYYYTSRNNYETSTAITGYVQEHSDCDLVYLSVTVIRKLSKLPVSHGFWKIV